MKTFRQRIAETSRRDWIKAAVWSALYLLFVLWVAWGDWISLLWLLLMPLICDAFTTRYIRWSWWKRYKPAAEGEPANPHANAFLYTLFSWIDAILFALIAVYFINLYLFQNYQIPSSSLEKSLRVGDFLFVSKAGYGARVPNTPLSMPLMQHTWPEWLGGGKSYIEHPQWPYKRLAGWKHPKKGDIVVFNFPAGDTVYSRMQALDAYSLRYQLGMEYAYRNGVYNLTPEQVNHLGTELAAHNPRIYGDILVRPVDRRENYVKRCVGEPGDTLQIINNQVYINGEPLPDHPGVQYNYYVRTDGQRLSASYLDKLGVNRDDRHQLAADTYLFPLTLDMKQALADHPHVLDITIQPEEQGGYVYPVGYTSWTRDNYGPVYIPRRGDTLHITADNYHIYRRIAQAYEHRPIRIGEDYVCQMDYYWMQGDNRHNSADSRYWGFVPEDHIVGQPIFIWLSIEKDNPWFHGHIRWNRIGKGAKG